MSLFKAISSLKSTQILSERDAQAFLDSLQPETQEQLIAAIYIGREHIHSTELRSDVDVSRGYTDHIPKKDYAHIIYEKEGSISLYLSKLEECASKSNFDIESI